MYARPTSHAIDSLTGGMGSASGSYQKRIKDLAGIYADSDAFARIVSDQGDDIAYTVHDVRPAQKQSDLIFGTTFMTPGQVGAEYFMTRGHIHATANRPEVYYGESGDGLMLMESPLGETRILEVKPRVAVYVPPMWIHRSINVGRDPLVMSFFYPSDAGQDYEVIARSGGMATRIMSDGEGWVAVPNSDYRPRSSEDVARLHKTAS